MAIINIWRERYLLKISRSLKKKKLCQLQGQLWLWLLLLDETVKAMTRLATRHKEIIVTHSQIFKLTWMECFPDKNKERCWLYWSAINYLAVWYNETIFTQSPDVTWQYSCSSLIPVHNQILDFMRLTSITVGQWNKITCVEREWIQI